MAGQRLSSAKFFEHNLQPKGLQLTFAKHEIDDNNGFLLLPQSSKTAAEPDDSHFGLMGDRYSYRKLLGVGTFAQIFEAEDRLSHQPTRNKVAIKVTRAGMQGVGMQESELLFELSRRPGFEGANIIRPYSAFAFEDHWCLVMEKMHGSLHEVVEQMGPFALSLECLQKLSFQLLTSLSFLASNGVVHADIRPENVLLRESPWKKVNGRELPKSLSIKVKLADMGNSFRMKNSSAYHDDFELQTLYYRAPEVLFGMPFTTQIDMWSLGCLLVEAYIGRRLFDSFNRSSAVATMAKTLGKFPRALFSSGKYYQTLSALPVFHTKEHVEEPAVQCQIASLLQTNNLKLISFISGCLEYDPERRLTPHQALCHPFLSSLCPLPIIIRDTLMKISTKSEAAEETQGKSQEVNLFSSVKMDKTTCKEMDFSSFTLKSQESQLLPPSHRTQATPEVKSQRRTGMHKEEQGDSPLKPKATRPREYSRGDVGRADKSDVKMKAKSSVSGKHGVKGEQREDAGPVRLKKRSSCEGTTGTNADVQILEPEMIGNSSKPCNRKRRELDSSPEPSGNLEKREATPSSLASDDQGGRRRLSDRANKGLKPQAWWVTDNQEMEGGGVKEEVTIQGKREVSKGKRESMVVRSNENLFKAKD